MLPRTRGTILPVVVVTWVCCGRVHATTRYEWIDGLPVWAGSRTPASINDVRFAPFWRVIEAVLANQL